MGVDFRAKQAEFAAYIRNPGCMPPPPDVDPARMAIYAELFFNNIDSFLSSNFPVLRSLYDREQWLAIARDFYARHGSRTPHFSEIAEEFLDYLQNERHQPDDYPFLLELAHYEWVEMALSIAKTSPVYGDEAFVAGILDRRVALSPLAWPLVYRYPVERIGPDFLPTDPPEQPTYLIVYRDAGDDVHFMQTTPFSYRLLQLAESAEMTGAALLAALAAEMPAAEHHSLLLFGQQALRELATKGIVIPADDA